MQWFAVAFAVTCTFPFAEENPSKWLFIFNHFQPFSTIFNHFQPFSSMLCWQQKTLHQLHQWHYLFNLRVMYFFPTLFFHILFTCYYIITIVLDGFPVWGLNRGPLGGCRVFLHSPGIYPGSGLFFFHHCPIRDPAVNLWLLDPLLANLFGVRFTSMSTSVCTP